MVKVRKSCKSKNTFEKLRRRGQPCSRVRKPRTTCVAQEGCMYTKPKPLSKPRPKKAKK